MNQWDQFLSPYKQAVDELKVKLKGLRKQYEVEENASPIEFVTGRVKPMTSIIDKANKRQISFDRLHEEMYDIAGLRLMCQFVDDIDVVVNLLRQREDFKVKLKGLRKQYEVEENTSTIEFVTGRVKPMTSIIDKANKRQISFDRLHEEMYDIAGLRLMCQFVDDIDVVVNLLRQREDFKV